MSGLYFDALVRMVIEHSKASTWRLAVREWDVIGCEVGGFDFVCKCVLAAHFDGFG